MIFYLFFVPVLLLLAFMYFRFSTGLQRNVNKLYERALIIGKFYPLHRGHQYLIETGLENTRNLVIIVCQRPEEKPYGELRVAYLREIYGKHQNLKRILLIDDHYDQDDSDLWSKLCINWLKPVFADKNPLIQAVFTSEKYGDSFCFYLSKYLNSEVKHHVVDLHRLQVPVSGTKIRGSPYRYLNYLHPIVRNYYIKRVFFCDFHDNFGKDYAQKLKSIWVPEMKDEISLNSWLDNIYSQGFQAKNFVFSNGNHLLRSENNNLDAISEFIKKFHEVIFIFRKPENICADFYEKSGAKFIKVKNVSEIDEVISKLLREAN